MLTIKKNSKFSASTNRSIKRRTSAISNGFNQLMTHVPHYICTANHLTGFYMVANIGRSPVKTQPRFPSSHYDKNVIV